MKTISVSVSDDEYKRFTAASDKESRSMSNWIRFILNASFVVHTDDDDEIQEVFTCYKCRKEIPEGDLVWDTGCPYHKKCHPPAETS